MSDLAFAFRALRRSPGFTAVAVLILALGIGAATVMFGTVDALVLRPLPLPAPERLATVYETNPGRNIPWFSCSYQNYADWRDRSRSWESLAAVGSRAANLAGDGGAPEFFHVGTVTANFLSTLGLAPSLGRDFLPEEDRPGRNTVAIVSHAFWQRRLGGATDVLGRKLLLDGTPHTIVGVTAAGAFVPGDSEILVPMGADAATERRMNHELSVYGRLKPGVTLAAAEAELQAIAARIDAAQPAVERGWSARLVPLARDLLAPELRTGLFVLLGAVGLLLAIAGANFSNLLLVRATARTHELAVRTALGASRRRVVRLIFAESLLVAFAGGLLGVLLSLWAVEAMHALPLPRAAAITVDPRVLAVALLTTALTGLGAALGPALQAARTHPQAALQRGSPRAGRRARVREGLVVAQLAIALTLLVGATLLGRSFLRLLDVDPGFDPANALTVSLRPVGDDVAFYERLTARVAALPGVTGTGLISALPLTEGNTSLNMFPRGESRLAPGESVQASWRLVDGGYFGAMKIPLLRGRTFEGLTPAAARRSVVISAALARELWGDADPLGRQIDPGGNGTLQTVIGVVGDVRSRKLGLAAAPATYWSMHRFIYGPMFLVVRTSGDPAAVLPAVRAAARELDPTVPVFRARTLAQLRLTSLEQEQLVLGLLGGFSAAALLLCALGTYGVVAFGVQQRTREIGIRLALGGRTGDILRLVLGRGARLAALGAVLGGGGALATTHLLGALLFETPAAEPWSYVVATAVLFAVAFAATLIPARRAARVDPVVALRAE